MITTNSIVNEMNALKSTQNTVPSDEISKTAFLGLLIEQLRSQDPLDPTNSEQFMSQMAQFSSLEQQINLNERFEDFLGFQALTQASSLIGKDVQAISLTNYSEGTLVDGTVEEVILVNGVPILKLSTGQEVPIQAVVKVGADLQTSDD